MTADEFAAAVTAAITQAKDAGLDTDNIITELEGILTGLREEAATD